METTKILLLWVDGWTAIHTLKKWICGVVNPKIHTLEKTIILPHITQIMVFPEFLYAVNYGGSSRSTWSVHKAHTANLRKTKKRNPSEPSIRKLGTIVSTEFWSIWSMDFNIAKPLLRKKIKWWVHQLLMSLEDNVYKSNARVERSILQ